MTRHEQLVENYENALFELLMEGVIEREGEQIEKENEQLKTILVSPFLRSWTSDAWHQLRKPAASAGADSLAERHTAF